MDKRLLDYDPLTGLITHFYYDDQTDETHIETRQTEFQLNRELDASKDLQNDEEYTKQGLKDEMLHYAHIPDGILHEWLVMGININDRKELVRMVNKPEYSYLKTTNLIHR